MLWSVCEAKKDWRAQTILLQRDTFATTCTDASDNGDPTKWDYLLSAVVTHDLVTFNKSGSRTNRMRCVDSENKSILLPNKVQPWSLPLIVFALNHVQLTSHAPPATASVSQGVVIVWWWCLVFVLAETKNRSQSLYTFRKVLTIDDDVFYLFLQKQKIGAKLHIYL